MVKAGWVKLSVDGSFKSDDGSAGAGMALRDDLGNPIFTSYRFLLNYESPFEAELRACKEGLEQALLQSTLPIIIETDCSKLVDAVKASTQDRSSLMYLISDIKSLSLLKEELVNLLRWNYLRLGLAISLLIWHAQIVVLSLG
jgi:ribonuclease HI